MSALAMPAGRRLPPDRLPGNRLHLQDGPIDLVIGAEGEAAEVEAAYARAERAFHGLLAALAAELPLLRTPVPLFESAPEDSPPRPSPPQGGGEGVTDAEAWLSSFRHPVARAMAAACLPHAALWVTPMAAVAGAVADHVLAALVADGALSKAWVNDGGDIAFHLAPGGGFELGLVGDLAEALPGAMTSIPAASRVRGAATSGRQGRSLSRGIADAVTVLAPSAAEADVAATLIANAVDLDDHPAVLRRPAREIVADSDLGDLPVVVALGPLAPHEIERALRAGAALAEAMRRDGRIDAALLTLRGRRRAVPSTRSQGAPAAWS